MAPVRGKVKLAQDIIFGPEIETSITLHKDNFNSSLAYWTVIQQGFNKPSDQPRLILEQRRDNNLLIQM